ncbi:MAG: hypothetical protein M3373_01805 [Gemmatimonadota bacterium]|nr:hypothetical protein [Gemmatimonadota bacterium]
MELQSRMMADLSIRARILADTAMRRLFTEALQGMPPAHRRHLERMMKETTATPKPPPSPHAGHRP